MGVPEQRIAAIVPCHNEAMSVAKVVHDLKAAVPGIAVYVYDNLSSDGTDRAAGQAGAIVRHEETKGKGNVLRRAFADVDADVYVLVDGDDTYEAAAIPAMIERLLEGPYDHVLGVRETTSASAYRRGHQVGNRALNELVSRLFGVPVTDMLSGCRVLSRRFVKSFPALSREFEIETELTVHCVTLRVPTTEEPVAYRDRPEGSESKLSTYRDGFHILRRILLLTRFERPILFHGLLGTVVLGIALVLGIPVLLEFARTGLVPRFPTAFLSASLVIVGLLGWAVGLVLDAITMSRREAARLNYLRLAPPRTAEPTESRRASEQPSIDVSASR
ncbi:glycosyltransferase [Mumia sp. zg.B53]|uniref:glycosyltransferase n=1 Tax=Mumia sp. zg.B53 TaxID=2855449 RepID=UPI001C6E460A|nr:glycosyltransferase [Mumia sp. zg.B53]MBW9214092.1 glycosyltransferase [Mumia sp. zg.B53]